MSAPNGILLVDKAPDRTSHDVVARVRWLLGTKKVGHAGTLDPMATGALILGIGQGTRLLTHLVGLDKTYRATIRLGQATTTDDREGDPLGEGRDAGGVTAEQIEEQLEQLRGDIEQVPSTVSAIKVDGRRAYARARAGEDVDLAARPVRISRFELTEHRRAGRHLDLDAVVTCSSGTYVRALARDLGAALGTGGHLTGLRRVSIGPFDAADGVHVPARGEGDEVGLPLRGLGETARAVLPTLPVDEHQARALGHGQRIHAESTPALPVGAGSVAADASAQMPVAALDPQGRLVAILTREDDRRRPVLVVPADARS